MSRILEDARGRRPRHRGGSKAGRRPANLGRGDSESSKSGPDSGRESPPAGAAAGRGDSDIRARGARSGPERRAASSRPQNPSHRLGSLHPARAPGCGDVWPATVPGAARRAATAARPPETAAVRKGGARPLSGCRGEYGADEETRSHS